MQFPEYRPKRMRRTEGLRRLVRETTLGPSDLVYPLFVTDGRGVRKEIASMAGQYQLSADTAVESAVEAAELGVPGVILFGLPARKDAVGSDAWNDEGPVQRTIRELKRTRPELVVMADACFCEYTSHGHCGVLSDGAWPRSVEGKGPRAGGKGKAGARPDAVIDNDATLENLGRLAVSYARAGVDVVAPSGMLDGFVAYTREALDEAGFDEVAILAYSAKYASGFYGPFRDAAESTPQFGDRRTYQMDPANGDEAIREVTLDVAEGADVIMVKPALAYLDVIRRVREEFDLPVAAYNVSGEYAMLRAAAERGWLDYDRCMLETLTSIKRAGADMILTYHAKEAARLLRRG